MAPRLRVVSVALLGLLAAPAVALTPATAAGPYPPPSSGSASVNPSRIKAGQCTTFSGDGFAPGASVVVRDDGVPAGSATAGRNGAFRLRLCYGTDARTGQHVISGTGRTPEGPAQTVSAVLTITGVEQSATGSPGGQSGGAVSGGQSSGAVRGGTDGPGAVVSAPQAVGVEGLGPAPRPDRSGSGDLVDEGLSFTGRGGLIAFLGLAVALVASAWWLLLLGRRRNRKREQPLEPLSV